MRGVHLKQVPIKIVINDAKCLKQCVSVHSFESEQLINLFGRKIYFAQPNKAKDEQVLTIKTHQDIYFGAIVQERERAGPTLV